VDKLKDLIEKYGLTVDGIDKRYICISAKGIILTFDGYLLFGLKESEIMSNIKQRFYEKNIKIDLNIPENNKPKTVVVQTIDDKKKNIRKILKTNKLIH